MQTPTHIEIFIPHEQKGKYFTIPFEMPEQCAAMKLTYTYPRSTEAPLSLENGMFFPRKHVNTIDLGLVAPDGSQVGASGSDKSGIFLSETSATPGYTPHPLTPGTWQILVGAYKVAPEGVKVSYSLTFTPKQAFVSPEDTTQTSTQESDSSLPGATPAQSLQLYIGDLHTHTIASDGILTVEELAQHAKRHGLDFLAITDHNQMSTTGKLPHIPGITLIPGVEWTHYQGHATFLGVDQPYDQPFFTNEPQEMHARFASAHARGALISIAHPFDDSCPFKLDMHSIPFDCLEVWNGPMRESNLRAVGYWLQLLGAGKKIPITSGSDYHRDALFQILGGPSMGVYSPSGSPSDLLQAVRAGHSFITFAPDGPRLQLSCGDAIMGDTLAFAPDLHLELRAQGLKQGDSVLLLSREGSHPLFQTPQDGTLELQVPISQPGFMAVQILRTFLPGIPPLPALLSNPIYVE